VAAFIAPPESLRGAKTSCSGTRQLYASRGPKMIRGRRSLVACGFFARNPRWT
jgi:hypothetical protein